MKEKKVMNIEKLSDHLDEISKELCDMTFSSNVEDGETPNIIFSVTV
jgi:ribosomal protein L29